jgi:WD40 repeat protein
MVRETTSRLERRGARAERRARQNRCSAETLDGPREECFQKIPGTVACLRYSERDDLVAMGLTGGGVLLWNVKTRSLFGKIPSGDDLIRSMEFSPVESSLTVLYANNRIIDYKYCVS